MSKSYDGLGHFSSEVQFRAFASEVVNIPLPSAVGEWSGAESLRLQVRAATSLACSQSEPLTVHGSPPNRVFGWCSLSLDQEPKLIYPSLIQ
jgi:hypothetical protein